MAPLNQQIYSISSIYVGLTIPLLTSSVPVGKSSPMPNDWIQVYPVFQGVDGVEVAPLDQQIYSLSSIFSVIICNNVRSFVNNLC